MYYGGEAFSVEQPQSFTCPYCGKMGYTETSLQEHVTSEHAETSTEVVSEATLCLNDMVKYIISNVNKAMSLSSTSC